jgi:putative ABC transport system permease protein
MLLYNLKSSLRNLKKNRLFSFLNLTGFTVGFTICIVLSLFIFKEFTVDKSFINHRNIYRLIDTTHNSPKMDYDIAASLKQKFPDIFQAAPVFYFSLNNPMYIKSVRGTDYLLIKEIISTTNDFFQIFKTDVLVGDKKNPFSDLNSVVITRSTANRLFGKTEVLGEIIHLDSSLELPVSAVVDDMPENSSFGADLFFNSANEKLRFSQSCHGTEKGNVCYNPVDVYVLINAKKEMSSLQDKVNSEFPPNKSNTTGIHFQPLTDIYLTPGIKENENRTGSKGLIYIFLSTTLLILLLSVINYIIFTLSRYFGALKTVGIKITNGANSSQLKQYYFTDITLSVILSFLLALYLASAILPIIENLLDSKLYLRWIFSWQLSTLFCVIVLIVVMVSMLAPSYIIKHSDVQMLFGKKGLKPGKRLGMKILTVFQVTVSMILLICLAFMQKQLIYVKTTDLGFDKELLLRINVPNDFQNKTALKQQIDNLSFVKSSSFSNGCPGMINNHMSVPETEHIMFNCIFIDRQFLETFNIELLKGRKFLDGDFHESCYINEKALKLYGWDNLENRKFNNGKEGGYNIVGVVKDFNIASLHKDIEPVCLIFSDQYSLLNLRLLPGNLEEQMNAIRGVWKSVLPGSPFSYVFFDDFFNSLYHKEDQQGKAIAFFSLIAFLITCLGMLGQIMQVTINKTKEIGVRRINGSSVTSIIMMLNKEFLVEIAVAFFIAVPVSYFIMNKWLANFAYKTDLSWWVFVLSGLLTLVIALVTISTQSWRAATRNPVEALRYE